LASVAHAIVKNMLPHSRADTTVGCAECHDSTDGEADITRVSAIGRELRKNGCVLNVAVPE
jgi:hypothetical protein